MSTILLTHGSEELRTRFPESALRALRKLGTVRMNETGRILDTRQLVALAQDCDIVVSDRLTPADARFFAACPRLIALCRGAVDIRNIDLHAAARAGVLVTNASATFVDAVAELGFGLMIDLMRGITSAAILYREGKEPPALMGRQLSGAILGVIGYGAIGRRLAALGQAFSMRVLACDPHVTDMAVGVERVDLATLLAQADAVVCLAISTPETDRLLDAAAFARIKRTAVFVNLARGPVVDDDALEAALREGRIAGAALDVGNEPGQMPKRAIAALPNVIATPHIGGLTVETAEGQALEVVGQAADILAGRMPHNALTADSARRFQVWKDAASSPSPLGGGGPGRGVSMTTKARHKVAVVGLGMAVPPHAKSLLDLKNRVETVYAFARSAARREAFARTFAFPMTDSLDAILNDASVDAVLLLTPPNTHLDLVRACAGAGKHILLEKPLETSMERAEALVEAARAEGVTLGVVLQHRFRPAAMQLREIIAAGRLGPLVGVSAQIYNWRPQSYYDQPGRGTRARDGGGVLLTQGIHTLDLMIALAGVPAEVTAYAATSPVHRMETEDIVAAAMRFDGGAMGTIGATTAAYPGFPERIELIGEKGTAVLQGTALLAQFHDGTEARFGEDSGSAGAGADPMAFPNDWHRALIADFLDAIEQGRAPAISGEEALKVHRLIDALLASAEQGQPVPVRAR